MNTTAIETNVETVEREEPTDASKHSCCVCGFTKKLDVCHACRRFVCEQHTRRVLFDCYNRVTLCPVDYLKEVEDFIGED